MSTSNDETATTVAGIRSAQVVEQQRHSSAQHAAAIKHSASITAVSDFGVVEAAKNVQPASPFAVAVATNLASASGGARILFATDEWFAAADNLLKDGPPQFDPDAYCEQGKVMDGWESRRRREPGHDWCVVKLSGKGRLAGVEVDTAHFTGNQVPLLSLEVANLGCDEESEMVRHLPGAFERMLHGCVQGTGASPCEVEQAERACRSVEWTEVLPKTPLRPGYEATRMHYFTFDRPVPVEATHLRVNYFPDGGVARLRLWGELLDKPRPIPGPAFSPIRTGRTCTVVAHAGVASEDELPSREPFDFPELSSQKLGGLGVICSNKHYGEPSNLIQPNLGRDMGDGWETARHPDRPSVLVKDPTTHLIDSPLMDWCILKLGSVAETGVPRVILDTKHFRGNYPESVQVDGCFVETDAALDDLDGVEWFPLVPRGRMAPDSEHVYDKTKGQVLNADRKVSHVKISIFPDGGLSRVRVYGAAAAAVRPEEQ